MFKFLAYPLTYVCHDMLFYEKPGDHINWHYDHNFYRGRHFTVLIPIVNRGREGGLSAARLMAKLGGRDMEVETPPNRLILFEGAEVRHKVTPSARVNGGPYGA